MNFYVHYCISYIIISDYNFLYHLTIQFNNSDIFKYFSDHDHNSKEYFIKIPKNMQRLYLFEFFINNIILLIYVRMTKKCWKSGISGFFEVGWWV